MHPSLQEYTVEAVARDCTNCDQLAQLFSSFQVNKKLSMVSAFFYLLLQNIGFLGLLKTPTLGCFLLVKPELNSGQFKLMSYCGWLASSEVK